MILSLYFRRQMAACLCLSLMSLYATQVRATSPVFEGFFIPNASSDNAHTLAHKREHTEDIASPTTIEETNGVFQDAKFLESSENQVHTDTHTHTDQNAASEAHTRTYTPAASIVLPRITSFQNQAKKLYETLLKTYKHTHTNPKLDDTTTNAQAQTAAPKLKKFAKIGSLKAAEAPTQPLADEPTPPKPMKKMKDVFASVFENYARKKQILEKRARKLKKGIRGANVDADKSPSILRANIRGVASNASDAGAVEDSSSSRRLGSLLGSALGSNLMNLFNRGLSESDERFMAKFTEEIDALKNELIRDFSNLLGFKRHRIDVLTVRRAVEKVGLDNFSFPEYGELNAAERDVIDTLVGKRSQVEKLKRAYETNCRAAIRRLQGNIDGDIQGRVRVRVSQCVKDGIFSKHYVFEDGLTTQNPRKLLAAETLGEPPISGVKFAESLGRTHAQQEESNSTNFYASSEASEPSTNSSLIDFSKDVNVGASEGENAKKLGAFQKSLDAILSQYERIIEDVDLELQESSAVSSEALAFLKDESDALGSPETESEALDDFEFSLDQIYEEYKDALQRLKQTLVELFRENAWMRATLGWAKAKESLELIDSDIEV